MARSIRGWIRNLADGLGPPPGSVAVTATVPDDEGNQDPLNQTDHALGNYNPVHVALSGDPAYADALGHWGWDMEFSPGPITQTIVPDDPQTEYRKRFPDESAPIGKAYHSDLERLAWTGGRDALVWNAIPGGHDPLVANWSWDPLLSSLQGNFSIASFGANMSFVLRRGIGFVGGTVFSVEMADLGFPYAGVSAAAANATAQDRWDVVFLHVVTDPTAYNYGKQQIEVITGTPGAGIPVHPGQPVSPVGRRLALHALKVPASSSAYTEAFDLRRWLWMPIAPDLTSTVVQQNAGEQLITTDTTVDSVLNTALSSNELKLPMGVSFGGEIIYSLLLFPRSTILNVGMDTWGHITLHYVPFMTGYDVRGTEVSVAGEVIPSGVGYRIASGPTAGSIANSMRTIAVPLTRIPSYHVDSNVGGTPRLWHRLRTRITLAPSGVPLTQSNIVIPYQRATIHLWPVA